MSGVKFGPLNFSNLLGFLFWINNEFRVLLPGKPPKEDILVSTLGSVRTALWNRLQGIKMFRPYSEYIILLLQTPSGLARLEIIIQGSNQLW